MRVNESDIDWQDSGDLAVYRGAPYTGEVVETIANGNVVSSTHFVDGRQDGTARIWFPDGTLRNEWTLVNGHAVGTSRSWHANGALAEEEVYDDTGRMVAHRRWAEDGAVLKDVTY